MTENQKLNLKLILLGLAVVISLAGIGGYLHYEKTFTARENAIEVSTETMTKREQAWESFLRQETLPTSVSVYVETGNELYVWNNRRVRAAGIIRLFIMADLFQQVKDGKMTLEQTLAINANDKVGGAGRLTGYPSGTTLTLRQLVIAMIADNDNTATNMLIKFLGMNQINEYISVRGYKDTIIQRKMMDNDAAKLGHENYTSAEDVGHLLTLMQRGKCVGPKLDKEMITILLEQENREGLSTAFPNKHVAHSMGAMTNLFHDGGIIYDDNMKNPYVLVVLNSGYHGTRGEALQTLWTVSKKMDKIIETTPADIMKSNQ